MFSVIAINYMDRVNFAVSTPAIRKTYGFSLEQIGAILFAWSIVYAVFNVPGGMLIDRIGLRYGLVLALGWWSCFTIATPFARSLGQWYAVRGLMGAGEASIWPLNAKAAHAWATPNRRSLFFTWAGSGQFVGPFIGNALAGLILVRYGWQSTFVIFGVLGLLVLPLWLVTVRERPHERGPRERADWPAVRAVFFSRTGVGMLLVYLTFGYILFTFLNWVPSYMYYTFHMSILKSALWASAAAGFGWLGFILSGPLNDWLVTAFDRLTARRIGAATPMLGTIACMAASLHSARAGDAVTTAVLLGVAQLLMNLTVGAWAVNVIDISPNEASTGLVYGIYNGVLNLMGAFNSLILTAIAAHRGFPLAFGSAIVFMLVFIASMLFVIDRPSYNRLVAASYSEDKRP
ncbi:MAG: MFS transporter [Candidatus Tyrphobacter sp.]